MKRTDFLVIGGVFLLASLSLCFLMLPPATAQTAATDAPQAASEPPPAPPTTEDAITRFCEKVFQPILLPIFKPVDRALRLVPDRAAGVCGVGLFVCAMIWVALLLNPQYVNRGRPYKSWWTDLRLWTVISMTPHVLVYFYFT